MRKNEFELDQFLAALLIAVIFVVVIVLVIGMIATRHDLKQLTFEGAQITTMKADTASLRLELDTIRAEVRANTMTLEIIDETIWARIESVDQMYSLVLERINDAARINLLTEDKIKARVK